MPGPDASAPMRVDRVLGGRYRLIRPIAKGGMAEVWEGHDDILSRPVAVKMLQPHLATDRSLVERFRREAVAAARLTHPGVVATFDTGSDGGTAWIVMELVRGHTLRQLLTERGPMDPPMAVDIAGQIADALAHAHRAGLIHRDIKPANVLLVEEDSGPPRAKVTDFGIAKATERPGLDLTRTGMVLGTPKYLSPEQVEGQEPDARADLYSLGVVLFEMLTCRVPFEGPTDMATAIAHVRQQPPRVSTFRPDVPPELDQLVADLLAKSPAARLPSATALRQALARIPLRPGSTAPSPTPSPTFTRQAAPPPPPPDGRVYAPRPMVPGAPGVPGAPLPPTPALGHAGVGNGPMAPPGGPPPNALHGGVGQFPPLPGPGPGDVLPTTAERQVDGRGFGGQGFDGRGYDRNGTAVTSYEGGAGRTGLLDAEPVASPPPVRRRRRKRGVGLIVGAVIVAGCVVAAVLLRNNVLPDNGGLPKSVHIPGLTPKDSGDSSPPKISDVQVWMMVPDRTPDNPDQTGNTFDGNPSTVWRTDFYKTATFGGLYSGEGLAIQLDGNHTLHKLTVESPTDGWSAETYVASSEPVSGQSPSAWGQPTQVKTGINGSTTFDLKGRSGSWVLFWLTNLGPKLEAEIAEFKVS